MKDTLIEQFIKSLNSGQLTSVQNKAVQYLSTLTEVTKDEVADTVTALTILKAPPDLIERVNSINKDNVSFFTATSRLVEAVGQGTAPKVRLIEAGVSLNKRFYPAPLLQNSVSLFEKTKCFANHPSYSEEMERPERNINDIVGWFEGAVWNEATQSIEANLITVGNPPILAIIEGAFAKGNPELIGLSIRGMGKSSVKDIGGEPIYVVESIDRILSVDLVTEPAAGGKLLRLSESAALDMYKDILNPPQVIEVVEETILETPTEELTMEAEKVTTQLEERVVEKVESIPEVIMPKDEAGVQTVLLGLTPEETLKLREDVQKMKCQSWLESKLRIANLPAAISSKITREFNDRVFAEAELDRAITEGRELYSLIAEESRTVATPIRAGNNEFDRMSKALQGLVLRKTIDGVQPFRSLHESYCQFNGLNAWDLGRDQLADAIMSDMTAASNPRTRLQEAISWTTAFANTMNRSLVSEYNLPGLDDWKLVTSDIVSLSDMRAQTIVRLGYYNTLATVAAGGVYQEPASPTDEDLTLTPAKYGRLESYTWEDALNDDISALQRIPGRLALSAKLTLYKAVFDTFANNPATTYDTTTWFHADHDNKGSGALTVPNLSLGVLAMRSQTAKDATSLALSVRPKYLLIGPTLEPTAKQMRDGPFYLNTDYYANPWRGDFEIIVLDYWMTKTADWFLVADPQWIPTLAVGFLNGKQEPDMMIEAANSGSHLTADKIYFKVRFVFGVAPVDHRGVYGYIA